MGPKTQKTLLLTFDLERCSPEALEGLARDPQTDGPLLEQIARLYSRNAGILELLVVHPRILPKTLLFLFNLAPPELKKKIQQLKITASADGPTNSVPAEEPDSAPVGPAAFGEIQEDHLTVFQRIQGMTVAEKVQYALRAGKDARAILLKDPNRLVALAVMNSPKITEEEVKIIAQSRNVSEEILRTVGANKEWMKNYSIMHAFACNPKTPLGLSLPLIPMIREKDLGILAKSRNVPEAIRVAAARLLSAKNKQV